MRTGIGGAEAQPGVQQRGLFHQVHRIDSSKGAHCGAPGMVQVPGPDQSGNQQFIVIGGASCTDDGLSGLDLRVGSAGRNRCTTCRTGSLHWNTRSYRPGYQVISPKASVRRRSTKPLRCRAVEAIAARSRAATSGSGPTARAPGGVMGAAGDVDSVGTSLSAQPDRTGQGLGRGHGGGDHGGGGFAVFLARTSCRTVSSCSPECSGTPIQGLLQSRWLLIDSSNWTV